ncbi:hypothetical protein [Sporosarcina sp. FSL K6-1508]|uniref:hypothetical protein n=1 Tax=Sporosarcina sp. FSL K6-1508 TaxID=2921553 RepID=UPI0030FAEBA7
MNEKILEQILAEMKEIKIEITDIKTEMTSVKTQLNENTQIVKVIRDRQEESDAKLENLAMDVHHMRGDLTALTGSVATIKEELEFTSHKTVRNEKEIFKLRKNSFESKSI